MATGRDTFWIQSQHNGAEIQVCDIVAKRALSQDRQKELVNWWLENVTSLLLP
jgi:hypothetical protein